MAKKAAKASGVLTCTKTIDCHCKRRTDVVQMLKNEKGRWYWRGLSWDNNQVTDTSGEDYSSKTACMWQALPHAVQLGVPLEVWE